MTGPSISFDFLFAADPAAEINRPTHANTSMHLITLYDCDCLVFILSDVLISFSFKLF